MAFLVRASVHASRSTDRVRISVVGEVTTIFVADAVLCSPQNAPHHGAARKDMENTTDVDRGSRACGCYPQVSWDETALPSETCCKELADRRWHDENEPMPTCGKPASNVIVSETGDRLPFCAYHWGRG